MPICRATIQMGVPRLPKWARIWCNQVRRHFSQVLRMGALEGINEVPFVQCINSPRPLTGTYIMQSASMRSHKALLGLMPLNLCIALSKCSLLLCCVDTPCTTCSLMVNECHQHDPNINTLVKQSWC